MRSSDVGGVQRPGRTDHPGGEAGPHHIEVADLERAADHRPIGVDEVQHASDGNVRRAATDECSPHQVDLPSDAVQEIGPVPAADDQPLDPRPEHSAAHLPLRSLPLVPFGIQDEDPGAADSNTVDVGSGSAPSRGWAARTRFSRVCFRRSYSRSVDAPATPRKRIRLFGCR